MGQDMAGIYRIFCGWIIWGICSVAAFAQDGAPTVIDFRFDERELAVEMKLSQNLVAELMRPETSVKDAVSDAWQLRFDQLVQGSDQQPLEFDLTRVTLTRPDQPNAPQVVYLSLRAHLKASASSIRIHWPFGLGDMVLRQHGVDDPFSGYFSAGQSSPSIALAGGAARAEADVFLDYARDGQQQVMTLPYVLFAIAMFLQSGRLTSLFVQIGSLLAGAAVALVCISYDVLIPPRVVLIWALPLLAALLFLDNIALRKLHFARCLALFFFAALQNLGFAAVLKNVGLAQAQILPAVAGFGLGLIGSLAALLLAAYVVIGLQLGRWAKYRGRVIMPVSVTLGGISLYLGLSSLPL